MIDRPDAPVQQDEELTLVLPDGATRTVPAGTLPADVVRSIGERLLSAAVAVSVDGEIQDLTTP
jgi:threonyl-tRNA synthetase